MNLKHSVRPPVVFSPRRRPTAIWRVSIFVVLVLACRVYGQQPVTIHLAGDSTMAEKLSEKRPETGWGECLQSFFDPERVRVKNYAKNGRSTRTFISEGLWASLLEQVHNGDYVVIQFGHNDESKEKVDRYTPPEDFRKNLIRFIQDVREKKATPILMTPLMRRRFDTDGHLQDTHGEYPDIVRGVAEEYKIALIDMHQKSRVVLEHYGPEPSRALFLQLKAGENPNYPNGIEDNSHFSPAGAQIMASMAVDGIREDKLPLTSFLKEQPAGATRATSACGPR